MLAYDYPILGLFWTMLIVFLWIAWLILLFRVFIDIFRGDMGGVSKAIWAIFVIVAPLLGVFIYLIAHGSDMTQRDIDSARQNEAAMQAYIRNAAGGGVSSADELVKLSDLHSRGVINEAEFAQQKAKLLAS